MDYWSSTTSASSSNEDEPCPHDHFSWAAIIRCPSKSCQREAREQKDRQKYTLPNFDFSESPLLSLADSLSLQFDKITTKPPTTSKHPETKPTLSDPRIPSSSIGPTISTIPEELRQEIISHLNYTDAWSLKKTSHLFHTVVEIPTIASSLSQPYGPSLEMLEEWEIIPVGYEACYYCHNLLPRSRFSRFQRRLTAARQTSLEFDYKSWRAEKHFCIKCGIQRGHYPRGERIFIGFGDPGYTEVAVVPCLFCGTLFDFDDSCCEDQALCEGCMKGSQLTERNGIPIAISKAGMICDREKIAETCTDLDVVAGRSAVPICEEGTLESEMEPCPKVYEDFWPEVMLSLVGERMISEGV